MVHLWNSFKNAWNYIFMKGLSFQNKEIYIDKCDETDTLKRFMIHFNNDDSGICVAKVIKILAIE